MSPSRPVIGLIVPPHGAFLHPDAAALYGERADFVVEGLGIDEMAEAAFDAATDRVIEAAARLGKRGADAVALLGTSLSFFRGPAFNRELEAAMQAAAGRPAVTATSALVRGLGSARRLAVGTAYDERMNARLRSYFEAEGFSVRGMVGMNIVKVRQAMTVRAPALRELGLAAWRASPGAEALVLSCGAFATAGLVAELQASCGALVVSSTPAALHAAFGLISRL